MKVPVGKIENFVSKDEQQKPAIQSVWLDVRGARLLATNGHMAIRVSVEVGPDDVSGLIPVEAFQLARQELRIIQRALDKGSIPDAWLNVVCNPDAIFIQNLMSNTTHLVVRPKLGIDEKFPAIDGAIPSVHNSPSISLSMDYLLEITKSLQMEGVGLSFWISAEEKAVVIASPLGKCVAALMPLRAEVDPEEVNLRGAPAKQGTMREVMEKVAEEVNSGSLDTETCKVTMSLGSDASPS